MKKLLFITVGLLCSIMTFGQVNFEEMTILDACAKAKQEKKQVFVFVYSTWYTPSLGMFDKVFVDEKVADWMNERFVSLKYDYDGGARSDLRRLSNDYGINTVPISFIFNEDGELENRIVIGHTEPDVWLKLMEEAMNVSLSDYAHKFAAGNRDVDFLTEYLGHLLDVALYNDMTKEVAQTLFQNLSEKQRTNPNYWLLFKDGTLSPVGSEYLEYVLSHFKAFCKGVGKDSVRIVVSTAYKTKLCNVIVLRDRTESLESIQEMMQRLKPYHLNDKDLDACLLLTENLMKKDYERVLTVAEKSFPTMDESTLAWAFWAVAHVYSNGDDTQKARVLQLRDKLKAKEKNDELRSILEQYHPQSKSKA